MLLAICSKNTLEPVLSVLDSHPDMVLRRKDFAAIVANYDDKATNIREIQEKLNIALDSLVFLDDSKFERDLVRTAFPEIQVPELPADPADYLAALAKWSLFEAQLATAEDRNRQDYYRNDEARAALRNQYSDFGSYLRDLKMKAAILGFDGFTLPRVSQLIQRSNQFNLTTIRYSEAELACMSSNRAILPLCIRLSDKLGDNGIAVVVVLRISSQEMNIDTWIMSCRLLGRGVEDFTLNLILAAAKKQGSTRIVGRYIPTSKNAMVANLYSRLGFTDASTNLGAGYWTLAVDNFEPRSTFIETSNDKEYHD